MKAQSSHQMYLSPLSKIDTKNLRTLIVEENMHVVQQYAQLLSRVCQVSFATNICDALIQIKSAKPDLIIVDIIMGQQNGFDLLHSLQNHSEYKSIPIIFLSSLQGMNYKSQAYILGGIDFIDKAINPEEFLYRVTAHLKSIRRMLDLDTSTHIDSHTGLVTNSNFTQHLNQAWRRCFRLKKPCTVIMVELDNWSRIEKYGSQTQLSQLNEGIKKIMLSSASRADDMCTFLPTGQFVLLLPECHYVGALAIATKIVTQVRSHKLFSYPLTVSAGACSMHPKPEFDPLDLLNLSQTVLAQIQRQGGNNSACYTHDSKEYIAPCGDKVQRVLSKH